MQAPLIPIVKDQTLLTYHERFSFCHILIRSCLSNVSTTDFSKVLSCDCSNRKSEENWPKKLFLLSSSLHVSIKLIFRTRLFLMN